MKDDSLLYSNEMMKHFKHPKNVGVIKNSDGIGKVGNKICGDVMWLYIKVEKDKKGKDRITDTRFQTFGCIAAISNTSLLTTMVKGKTLDEAMRITKNDILKKLGKVPPIKIHCSVLSVDALHEAIYDYYQKNKLPISEELQKEHERVAHTIEEIEHRHHDFFKMEEDILKK